MNIKAIFISAILFLFSPLALAGTAGHGHSHEPVTQQQAEQVATRIVGNLAKKGVIDNSWNDIQVDKSEKKQFGNSLEWVVSYRNAAVSDPGKRTLYIFLTLTGDYIAANYTGK